MTRRMEMVVSLCLRTWVKLIRRPIVLAFTLVQPIMWMVFFGFLFHHYGRQGLPENVSYLDFLMPGICVMTVLFGASQSGVSLIRDMQTGFLIRLLNTPARSIQILAGKIFADVTRFLGQAVLTGLIGWVLGASLRIAVGPFILGILYLALFGIGYSCLSCWIALKTRSQEALGAFIHIFNMPLLFTSSVLVPSRHMPDWLAGVAAWNPLTMVVDMMRGGLLFGKLEGRFANVIVLGTLAIVFFLAAASALKGFPGDKSLGRKSTGSKTTGGW